MKKILTTAAIIAGLYLNPIQAQQNVCEIDNEVLGKITSSQLTNICEKLKRREDATTVLNSFYNLHTQKINCYLTMANNSQPIEKVGYLFNSMMYYTTYSEPMLKKLEETYESMGKENDTIINLLNNQKKIMEEFLNEIDSMKKSKNIDSISVLPVEKLKNYRIKLFDLMK